MTRLEKCELAKKKGFTYNSETGEIFGVRGNKITGKDNKGYSVIGIANPRVILLSHHFAWYMTYGNVDFDLLDHINRNPSDNRICNLRIATHQENMRNTKRKGYHKYRNKWRSTIYLNGKPIYLGLFNSEYEARESYINAKKKYHNI